MAPMPTQAQFTVANVRGLGETLAALKEIAPEMERQARKELRGAVKPMIDTARSLVPDEPPLSRWRTGSAAGSVERSGGSRFPVWTGAAKRRIGFRIRKQRVRKSTGRLILLRMIQNDPAGAVYDMAGRKNSNSQFARNLTGKGWGDPSRHMWPAAEKNLSEVQAAIEDARQNMETVINNKLRSEGRVGFAAARASWGLGR